MGKVRTSYNNKPRHKPSAKPAGSGGGRNFTKRPSNRPEGNHDEGEVSTGSKSYQKAVQARDRYQEMAREALVTGDRVTAENYHQHADHYSRIINAALEVEQERAAFRRQRAEKKEAEAAEGADDLGNQE